jgi:hypothetical protein
MPSLLTIPHEIRDAILETVLLSSRPAPPDVATAAEHRLEPLSCDRLRCAAWDYGPSHTRFERSDYVSNAYPLLLVNQQLSAETKSAVSRLTVAGLSYKLDVMFVQEREVWPTWLCIPSLAEQVDHVDVTFRIFETTRDTSDRSAFRGGNGSPPQIYWCFYFLLEHFLTHGPLCPGHGKTSKRNKNREVSVKTVNLNFVAGDTHLLPPTKEEVSYHSWWHPQRRMHFGGKRQQDDAEPPKYIIRPEWLAKTITGPFCSLLSMDYHTAAYGGMIHERMGSVRFNVDGELPWEVDIGARLASLSFAPTAGHTWYTNQTFGHVAGEDRLRAFWRWKEGAVRKRKERGLPVPDPVAMPAP